MDKTENTKRILIVSSYYPPHMGGLENVAYNQAKRLSALGHQVRVISSRVHEREISGSSDGVELVRIAAFNRLEKWGIPFPIFSPRIVPALVTAIKKADLVHIHDIFYLSSLLAAILAYFYKKPIILTQHVGLIPHPSRLVTWVQKFVFATSGRLIFRLSSRIIILNDRVRRFLLRLGVPENKIIFLPNGVDTDQFFPPADQDRKKAIRYELGLDPERKLILFVGRFVPKKGFNKVIAASSDDYQLVFAGGNVPGLSGPNIVFLGEIDPDRLRLAYQAADIFILPSEGEGFPLTIQEAMASGLPIITTDDEGYHYYGLDKEMVYLLNEANDESVKKAIEELVIDEVRREKMSRYSQHYARSNFSWSELIARLDNIYNELLQEHQDGKYPNN